VETKSDYLNLLLWVDITMSLLSAISGSYFKFLLTSALYWKRTVRCKSL